MKTVEGMLSATGRHIALVAGRFNDMIVSRLIEGAADCFLRHNGMRRTSPWSAFPGAWRSRSWRAGWPPRAHSMPLCAWEP